MPKSNEKLVQNTLKILERDFIVVGKTRVRSWHAWLAIGLAAGVLFVANRSGEFEVGLAQVVAPTTGNVYYVATNGNDGNSCADARDINKPKKTINAGIGCLASSDTLLIRGGTYGESIYKAPIPNGVSWDKATKIARYGNEVVILRPPAGCFRVLYLEGNPSDTPQYMIFDGLVMDAINCASDVVKLGYRSGEDYPYTPHHIRIANSEIMNSNDMGILGCGA